MKIPAGTTSFIKQVFVPDSSSTVGAGLTGLAFGTAGLTAYYKRSDGTAAVVIGLATITTFGTWETGGFKEVSAANMPGVYEFHLPNAALIAGASNVTVILKGAANMAPVLLEIDLVRDDVNAVAWLGTAIPGVDTAGYPKVTIKDGTGAGEINTNAGAIVEVTSLTNPPTVNVGTWLGSVPNALSFGSVTANVLRWLGTTPNALINSNVPASVSQWGGAGVPTLPANFNMLTINATTGAVTAGTVSDKTGYALTVAPPTASQIKTELEASTLLLRSKVATQNAVNVSSIGQISATLSGPGNITYTNTITGPTPGSFPVDDVAVWVTTDEAGNNTIGQTRTTTLGVFTFYLNAGTYYLRFEKAGFTFTNPTQITVA